MARSLGSWGVRRSRARAPLVLALGALVLVASAVLTGLSGWTELSGSEGLRDYLGSARGDDAALLLRTRLGDAEQSTSADDLFSRELAGLPVVLSRSVTTAPRPVVGAAAGAEPPTVRLAALADLSAHARVTRGRWATTSTSGTTSGATSGVTPVAVPVAAAEALDLDVGDSLSVQDAPPLVVAALWEPRRRDDPLLGALATGTSAAASALGPLVVPEEALARLSPYVGWTVTADARTIAPGDIGALTRAVERLPEAFDRADGVTVSGSLATGGLGDTLRTLDRSETAASAVRPVPTIVIAAITLLMLVQLARVLALQRRSETALVRSRGASGAQLARLSLVEAAALSVPAAGVGAGAAAAVLLALGGSVQLVGWLTALAVALTATVVVAAPGLRAAREGADRQLVNDSGRARAVTAAATLLLAVAAAAVATWRFRSLGSAVFLDRDGTPRTDPLAVTAPALVLVATSLVCVAVFVVGAGVVERLVPRRRGLDLVLGARQVARRTASYGVIVLLLGVSLGAVGLAAAYAPTRSAGQERVDALAGGAAVDVELPARDPLSAAVYADTLAGTLARVQALEQVDEVLPVQRREVTLGTTSAGLLGASSDGLADVLDPAVADLGAALAPTVTRPIGVALPPGTSRLTLRLAVEARGTSTREVALATALWLQSPDGSLAQVRAGTVGVPVGRPSATGVSVDLSDLTPGSRLVAIDTAQERPEPSALSLGLRVTGIESDGRDLPLPGQWELVGASTSLEGGLRATTGAPGWSGATTPGSAASLRLMPGGPDSLPVVVDRRLARLLGLARGDSLNVAVDAARVVRVTVASVVPELPGDQSLPLVGTDLGSLSRALLRTSVSVPGATGLWVRPAGSASAAIRAVTPAVPTGSALRSAEDRSADALVAPAATTLWLGGLAALALALVGVLSVVVSAASTREEELVVLRSVGVSSRRQARSRGFELTAVMTVAVLGGLVAATVAVLVSATDLAGSTLVGRSGPPTLLVDAVPLALVVTVLVVVLATIVAGHVRRTARDAARATPSEVGR